MRLEDLLKRVEVEIKKISEVTDSTACDVKNMKDVAYKTACDVKNTAVSIKNVQARCH